MICWIKANRQEVGTGNLHAAEAHLEGLMALLDRTDNRSQPDGITQETADSVLQRYIMICIQEIMRLRIHTKRTLLTKASPIMESLDLNDELSRGVTQPMADFNDRLLVLWLMPYFHLANQDLRSEDLDATEFIHSLRAITSKYCGCRASRKRQTTSCHKERESGAYVTRFFLSGLSKRGEGPVSRSESSDNFRGSWAGFSITMGFYLYGLVGLGSPEDLIDGRALGWLMRMLQRDIKKGLKMGMDSDRGGPFWLWKVVLGAFAVVSAWRLSMSTADIEKDTFGSELVLVKLKLWFYAKIRLWSKHTNIRKWEDARDVLASVVWPKSAAGEQLASVTWEEAVSGLD